MFGISCRLPSGLLFAASLLISLITASACDNNHNATPIPSDWIHLENRRQRLAPSEISPIPMDNCTGNQPVGRTSVRSFSRTTVIEFSIMSEIEASAEIIRARIANDLGIRIGETVSASETVEVSINPATQLTYEVIWYEAWEDGEIVIGNLGLRIPYSARIGVQSEIRAGIPVPCAGTITPVSVEPSAQSTNTPRPLTENTRAFATPTFAQPSEVPASPSSPLSFGTLTIPGDSNQGVQYQVRQSGTYVFVYVNGAYSVDPDRTEDVWLPTILIFRGRVQWDGERIKDEEALVRVGERRMYFSSAEEAESAVQEDQSAPVYLSQGEMLILIGIDHYSFYFDNLGEVDIEVVMIQE